MFFFRSPVLDEVIEGGHSETFIDSEKSDQLQEASSQATPLRKKRREYEVLSMECTAADDSDAEVSFKGQGRAAKKRSEEAEAADEDEENSRERPPMKRLKLRLGAEVSTIQLPQ